MSRLRSFDNTTLDGQDELFRYDAMTTTIVGLNVVKRVDGLRVRRPGGLGLETDTAVVSGDVVIANIYGLFGVCFFRWWS